MTTAIRFAQGGASERLTLNNPAQARKGAVWGCATCVPDGVPKARALKTKTGNESATLRDAGGRSRGNPTLRFERGCSPRSRPHACAGILKACASGTICSLSIPASERLTLNNPSQAVGAVWGAALARKGAVWGCATCVPDGVPEARALNPSVFEEVLLSYSKPTLFQQSTVLLCKRNPFVMFLLPFDVVHNLVLVVYAIGESGIFMSPAIEMGKVGISLEPFACECFDGLHILCHRYGGWEGYKDMHVVGHTTYTIDFPVHVVGLFHDDGIELAVVPEADGLLTAISAKDYVVERLDVTHNNITQGSDYYCVESESASLRDAGGQPRGQPHTAL